MRALKGETPLPLFAHAAALAAKPDGAWVRVAGVVLVRQRPGSAKGVIFMTIEDETGIANAVVWPKTLSAYRQVVLDSRLILIQGRMQKSPEGIIHVIAARLIDRSPDLMRLWEENAPPADDGTAPSRTEPRGVQQPAPHRHPRDQRVVPRSRDFH